MVMRMSTKKRLGGRQPRTRQDEGLAKAIAAAGSVSDLAGGLGLSVQAVSQWDSIPVKRCAEIEDITGVSLHEQRPDVFPPGTTRKRVRAAGRHRVAA
jgi:DNA-binding transcriptional regulator YdaS (Cro superfamily)